MRRSPGKAKQPGEGDEDDGFHGNEPDGAPKQPNGIAGKLAEIDVHADRKKEQAEQETLERIDGGLDRLAEFGLGEQQAGDEGAKRHGEAGHGGGHPGCDDHEQRGGHEQVAHARGCDQTEQRPHHHAADDDDHAERDGGVGERQHESAGNRTGLAGAENGDEQQERRHRQILRQQDRETGPARARVQPSLPGKHLDDDGGRRQRQAGTDDERHRRLAAGKDHDCADRGCGEHDLQAAQSENQAAHRLQPLIGQLHADQEQQEHDAEVCESRRRSWRRPR